MAHTHITKQQRFNIQSWLEIGMEQVEIAERLGKDKSAISRELTRNSYPDGRYQAGHADYTARNRKKISRRRTKKLVQDKALRRSVINRLKKKDSPEQWAGRRKRQEKTYVCHETIYQYLYTERQDLAHLLRRKKNKYRRRHGTKQREKERELAKKTWTTERPEIINNRAQQGHWEGDTIKGKRESGSIGTHVERTTGYGLAHLMRKANAETMRLQTIEQFIKIPKNKRLSETLDNGSEFGDFELTERSLDFKIYFAAPYHSWERGSNENWNGLLRQFFPKGTDFSKITQKDVDNAVRNLNHRPRKRLNYLTPHEVFVQDMSP